MDHCRSVRRSIGCLLLTLIVALTGCTDQESSSTAAVSLPVNVIATVGMVADLVRNVGGDRVSVTQVCGSGVDPHLYKPTRDDVQLMMRADMVFFSGLMLEGKMADTLAKLARQKPVLAVTSALGNDAVLHSEAESQHADPHVWMDVAAWSRCVGAIEDALSTFDPAGAPSYQNNAAAYQEQLGQLDQYARDVIGSIPPSQRLLVTSHDAFAYLGRAYGIEVVGIQGLSTESEAGLQRINELVDRLVNQKVSAVFIESSVSRKNMDALVEGAASRGQPVTIGGELYSDAMGPGSSYEGTYIGMIDHNVTRIATALGGTAPPRGWQGKLSP